MRKVSREEAGSHGFVPCPEGLKRCNLLGFGNWRCRLEDGHESLLCGAPSNSHSIDGSWEAWDSLEEAKGRLSSLKERIEQLTVAVAWESVNLATIEAARAARGIPSEWSSTYTDTQLDRG